MFDFSFSGTDHFVIEKGILHADIDVASDDFGAHEIGTAPNTDELTLEQQEEARANLWPCGRVTRVVFELDGKELLSIRIYAEMPKHDFGPYGNSYPGWHEWDITELAPTQELLPRVLADLRQLYVKCAAIRKVK